MKAAVYTKFQGPIDIIELEDPTPTPGGVVLKVEATGICRSDWHGWMGHDPDISLPHVPGHEIAGTIVALGKDIKNWNLDDRVTLPFVCGCGVCNPCISNNQQVCDNQFQPGFTNWGSFAEYVAIEHAEDNLYKLPDEMRFEEAASLGCRFITAFRAVIDQGKLKPGEHIAIFGCGGVGLSAIMIAHAIGAVPIAIDILDSKLAMAESLGAAYVINNKRTNAAAEIKSITNGGCAVAIDALGSDSTLLSSINSLRKQGKHIQVGLMAGDHSRPIIPMDMVIGRELEILGSHGMQAHRFGAVFELVKQKKIPLVKLIESKVDLAIGTQILMDMDRNIMTNGIAVINKF